MAYYHRTIWDQIKKDLELMPAVFLNGPRQVGKSTMMQQIAQKYMDASYVTFDNLSTLASAARDPEGFLRSFTKPVIIDEVQKVPSLYPVIKLLADEYRLNDKKTANGRFLLTGSVNIMVVPKLAESLVGRMSIVTLYPLSASEVLTGECAPVIVGWFGQKIAFKQGSEELLLDKIIHQATFPEVTTIAPDNIEQKSRWFDDYTNTLLQRDIRDLAEIEKLTSLPDILKLLAARAGSMLNDANCAADAKLNVLTYKRYRILLENLFLITLVQPWYRNINLKLVRTPKVYFSDTALLCNQLGVNAEATKTSNPHLFGHILENFVFSELQKQLNLLSNSYRLYYFRLHGNKEQEVDFVIERKDGSLIGIEVKKNYSVGFSDFISLGKLKNAAGKDFVRGIVLYCGKDTLPFGEDMIAMPVDALWNFNMKIEFEEAGTDNEGTKVIIWAKYGDRTYVRCDIDQEVIADYFFDNLSSREEMIDAIKNHSDVIEPIFTRKIMGGLIYNKVDSELVDEIHYDHGGNCIGDRHQTVLRIKLLPSDFGYRDFRNVN